MGPSFGVRKGRHAGLESCALAVVFVTTPSTPLRYMHIITRAQSYRRCLEAVQISTRQAVMAQPLSQGNTCRPPSFIGVVAKCSEQRMP